MCNLNNKCIVFKYKLEIKFGFKKWLLYHTLHSTLFVSLYLRSSIPGPVWPCLIYYIYIYIYIFWGWLDTAGSPRPMGRLRLDGVEVRLSLWFGGFMGNWVQGRRLTYPTFVPCVSDLSEKTSSVMLWYGASMEVAIIPVRLALTSISLTLK